MTQLTLWQDDDRPLPLLVAEQWGFALQFHIVDGEYWYALQDWVRGLAGGSDNAVWSMVKRLRKDSDLSLNDQSQNYRAKDGKTYQRPYVQDADLYRVISSLRALSGRKAMPKVHAAIVDYLARAGVLLDSYRRDPETMLITAQQRATQKYTRLGHPQTWINDRLAGTLDRRAFTDSLLHAIGEVTDGSFFGRASNAVYRGVFKRGAKALRKDLGLPDQANLRDHLSRPALNAIALAESLIAEALGDSERISPEQALALIHDIAAMVGLTVEELQRRIGRDLITGRPLLPDAFD